MPPYAIVMIFGALGVAAAWAVQRDLVRGLYNDEWHERGETPFGYLPAMLPKIFTLWFCTGEVFHAFGLVGDPLLAIRAALSFLHS